MKRHHRRRASSASPPGNRGGGNTLELTKHFTSISFYTGAMTKAEFVDSLAKRLEFSKQESERVLDAVLETLRSALVNGEKVDLRGLGSFKVRESKSRQGRNPRTGETIVIAAKRSAAFRPGKEISALLNEPVHSTEQ